MKLDNHSLVAQPVKYLKSGWDGGDSLNYTSIYYMLTLNTNDDIYFFNEIFESKRYPGLYVRHPDPAQTRHAFGSFCAGNFNGVESRDQMTGKLCYFAMGKHKDSLKRSLKQHLKRGMIFANNSYHNGEQPLVVNRKKWYKHAYEGELNESIS